MTTYHAIGLPHHGEPVDTGDAAGDVLDNYKRDPRKIAEAREFISGTMDESQYTDLERLLDQLYDIEADRLVGSDTLAGLWRLSGIYRRLRDKRLAEMAEDARREA